MTDPLSIITSVITIIGTADAIGKTLMTLKKAPADILALYNEIADLRIVLDDVGDCLLELHESTGTNATPLEHTRELIGRADKQMTRLNEIINSGIIKSGSLDGDFKLSRMRWMRARAEVEAIRHDLREIRLNVVTQMTVINASHQASSVLMIDDISFVASEIRADQVRDTVNFNHRMDEQYRLIRETLEHSTKTYNALQFGLHRSLAHLSPPQLGLDTPAGMPFRSSVQIKTSLRKRKFAHCGTDCCCKCHEIRSLNSPPFLDRLLGKLFIGYSGCPAGLVPPCDDPSCGARSSSRTRVVYLFPSWFCSKVLDISFETSPLGEPSFSLAVYRAVPTGSKIFQLTCCDDVPGLQLLFRDGLASPNDIDNQYGYTPLQGAIQRGQPKSCKALLDAGADPHFRDSRTPMSPFDQAWEKILSTSKTTPMSDTLRTLFPRSDDFEDLCFSPLHRIILGLSLRDLSHELALLGTEVDSRDAMGRTALHWASRRGDVIAVDLLLRAGADPNAHDYAADGPLTTVTSYECAMLLLDAGADIYHRNSMGMNSVIAAASSLPDPRYIEELLVRGVDLNGHSASQIALQFFKGHEKSVVRMLLDHGVHINGLDDGGNSALFEFIWAGDEDSTQLLLERGADYSTTNHNGFTVLHVSAAFGSLGIIRALQAATLKGIDVQAKNVDGVTALNIARQRVSKPDGFLEAFQSLLFQVELSNGIANAYGPVRPS